MTVSQAISAAEAVTGQVFSATEPLRWLSELDGQLAFEVYGVDTWTAYGSSDLSALLLVPYPWDGLYVHWLEAMTYYSNGEYDRAANARAQYDNALGEFRRFVQRTRACCGEITIQQAGDGGSAVTVIERGCDLWRYMSAYGTAVLHGYTGTPEEWLESLKGEQGEPGTVSFDELTPEQIAMITGPEGPEGPQGPKGDTGNTAVVLDAGSSAWTPVPGETRSVAVTAAQYNAIAAAIGGAMPVYIHWTDTDGYGHWAYCETGKVGTGSVTLRATRVTLGTRTVAVTATVTAYGTATLGCEAVPDIWVGTQEEYEAITGLKSIYTYYAVRELPASISVTTLPDKTTYTAVLDDKLDLTGMEVTMTDTAGDTEDVTADVTTDPEEGDTLGSIGDNVVTVTYRSPDYAELVLTDSFTVVVEDW